PRTTIPRNRCQRGAALAWAMLLLAAVATAVALSGSAISRQVRLARLEREAAALDDLRESAFAVGRIRSLDPSWRGPELLELEHGSATVGRRHGPGDVLHVEARACLTGRVVITERV